MGFCLGIFRYGAGTMIITFGSFLVAADVISPAIIVNNVRTADDIISRMPSVAAYYLKVRFAHEVDSAARTAILTQAFAHARAAGITKLDIADNFLSDPPILTGLKKLQTLNLSFNRLIQSPQLTGLVDLRKLWLDYNKLTYPPDLAGLVQLTKLDLSDNNLIEPPVLTGLAHLKDLYLGNNFLDEPVIIPSVLVDKINLAYIGAPFKLEVLDMRLIDIATPGVDTVPFFFTRDTIKQLKGAINPITRGKIVHAMNLVESWCYWRDHGMSAEDFDARLREKEPVMYEENIYTVDRHVAHDFLRERGMNKWQIKMILSTLRKHEINVTALLDLMHAPQIEQLGTPNKEGLLGNVLQAAVDLVQESCVVS